MSLKSDYLSSFGKTLKDRFNIREKLTKKRINKVLFIPDKNYKINIDEKIKEECDFNISELKKRIKLYNKEKKENSDNKKINNKKLLNIVYKFFIYFNK